MFKFVPTIKVLLRLRYAFVATACAFHCSVQASLVNNSPTTVSYKLKAFKTLAPMKAVCQILCAIYEIYY